MYQLTKVFTALLCKLRFTKPFTLAIKIVEVFPRRFRMALGYAVAELSKLVFSICGETNHSSQKSVSLTDLKRLVQLHEQGTLVYPRYAFAGGTALQCWLQKSGNDRIHQDIDLFTFTPDVIQSILGQDVLQACFLAGGFAQGEIASENQGLSVEINIAYEGYFDAEIIPTIDDLRIGIIQELPVLVLSPEFIAISKLSYPNVHRLNDLVDIISLNQAGQLQESQYLTSLLARTSLGKIIDVESLLNLKNQDDLHLFLDFIRLQLIGRFSYWKQITIEELDPLHLFLLLDIHDEFVDLSVEKRRFVDEILVGTTLQGQTLTAGRLGLYLLVVGLPDQRIDILTDPGFQAATQTGLKLAESYPSYWLACQKTLLKIFQQLKSVEKIMSKCGNCVWNPNMIAMIVEKMLVENTPRLLLYTSIKSMCYQLSTSLITESEFSNLLADASTPIRFRSIH